MPLEISTAAPILRVRFYGRVSNDELAALARETARIEGDFEFIPNRLADLRDISDLAIDFTGVLALAEDRRARRFSNPFKSAIVADDMAHYGFARMFQTLNDHPQITIAIFPDLESAERWLAEPGVQAPAEAWSPSPRAG